MQKSPNPAHLKITVDAEITRIELHGNSRDIAYGFALLLRQQPELVSVFQEVINYLQDEEIKKEPEPA